MDDIFKKDVKEIITNLLKSQDQVLIDEFKVRYEVGLPGRDVQYEAGYRTAFEEAIEFIQDRNK